MLRFVSILAEFLAAVIVIGLFTSLLAAAVAILHLGAGSLPGENNPQYAQFLSELERYRTILKGRAVQEGDELDISTLNGGNWRTACLVGGYKDYVKVINAHDPVDWKPKMSSGVGEFEMALVYVDAAGMPDVVHFRSGVGPYGQHFARCIAKPETRIPLSYS